MHSDWNFHQPVLHLSQTCLIGFHQLIDLDKQIDELDAKNPKAARAGEICDSMASAEIKSARNSS